jgi:hypothetical protein
MACAPAFCWRGFRLAVTRINHMLPLLQKMPSLAQKDRFFKNGAQI